jgi:hypothetical protein
MKVYSGTGSKASHILNLNTKLRCVIGFMFWQLYLWEKVLASSSILTGCVGSRLGLDMIVKREILLS